MAINGSDLKSPAREQPFRIYNASTVGTAIRQYRKRQGLTQAQLAREIGTTQTYISEIENGKETEALRLIFAIFRRLGLRATLQHEDW